MKHTCPPAAPSLAAARPAIPVKSFGALPDGRAARLYTLANLQGVKVSVTNYGARIVSWIVPDRDGNPGDIVLGFDNVQDYINSKERYFGAAIGRYANRISRGRFTLDGVEYRISPNEGPNALHGGPGGFHAILWDTRQPDARTLECTRLSPDGDQGFPGNLQVRMRYTLTDDNALVITYEAVTDRPTVVNLTNHSFFNLRGAGAGDIGGHLLSIRAGHCTPTDDMLIPTGEIAPVSGADRDFRLPAPIGARRRRGLNFVLDRAGAGTAGVFPAARVVEPESGRVLEVLTDQPGLQLYCGDALDGSIKGKDGKTYGRRSALCLETQNFPDSPNHHNFPSSILRPGETYRHTCIYKTSVSVE
ncbi:MAG: galactose mutarotase [Opitutaceae bacterium]|nr:galactose mutarotase [Opitutaceae bacterium]